MVGNSGFIYNNFVCCEWLIKGKVYLGVKNIVEVWID